MFLANVLRRRKTWLSAGFGVHRVQPRSGADLTPAPLRVSPLRRPVDESLTDMSERVRSSCRQSTLAGHIHTDGSDRGMEVTVTERAIDGLGDWVDHQERYQRRGPAHGSVRKTYISRLRLTGVAEQRPAW